MPKKIIPLASPPMQPRRSFRSSAASNMRLGLRGAPTHHELVGPPELGPLTYGPSNQPVVVTVFEDRLDLSDDVGQPHRPPLPPDCGTERLEVVAARSSTSLSAPNRVTCRSVAHLCSPNDRFVISPDSHLRSFARSNQLHKSSLSACRLSPAGCALLRCRTASSLGSARA